MKKAAVPFLSILALLFNASTIFAQATPIQENDGFAGIDQIPVVFGNVVRIVTPIAGFAALAFIAIGAFRYMTSQGDPKAVASARATIFWAIGGLTFIVISYLIIVLISEFTGVSRIENFCVTPTC